MSRGGYWGISRDQGKGLREEENTTVIFSHLFLYIFVKSVLQKRFLSKVFLSGGICRRLTAVASDDDEDGNIQCESNARTTAQFEQTHYVTYSYWSVSF